VSKVDLEGSAYDRLDEHIFGCGLIGSREEALYRLAKDFHRQSAEYALATVGDAGEPGRGVKAIETPASSSGAIEGFGSGQERGAKRLEASHRTARAAAIVEDLLHLLNCRVGGNLGLTTQ
jgi:hypothetical protein